MSNHQAKISSATNVSGARGWIKPVVILGLVAISVVGCGIVQRCIQVAEQAELAAQNALVTVSVVKPVRPEQNSQLVLTGTLQAQNTSAIYAQVNGYIEQWLVDIGDKVEQGQLLAVIAAPELKYQLAQARADLSTAIAESENAQSMARRAQQLMQSNSGAISIETLEQRQREAQARIALVTAAQANVQRLEALQSFTRLTSPFKGVITSRNVQLGELVTAGNGSSLPLFTIADIDAIRVYVNVPQNYTSQLHIGQQASISLPEYPQKHFVATVVRSAGAVNPASGAVLTELATDNAERLMMPGAFARVSFEISPDGDVLQIPGSAIIFREARPAIAVVNDDNQVSIKPISILRDEGSTVQVIADVTLDEWVISTPPDAVRSGDQVRAIKAAL